MEESRKTDEERALAMAAVSLVKALIDVLEQEHALGEGGAAAVFERALTALEFRHQDGATRLARRIVEAHAISREPPPE